jgi:folate-dependent phosphoribosylglycinamide formyltransferase PurN
MSIVVITADELRHKYFVNELAKKIDIGGVISETKIDYVKNESGSAEASIISEYFKERDEKESEYFNKEKNSKLLLSDSKVLKVKYNEASNEKVLNWVLKLEPALIVVYGASIIKDPLISKYDGRIINLHLGLSPYYKGSGTNFWPLVNKEPEYVGATAHILTADIDAGPILKQVRPNIALSDQTPHDLGCKTIISSVDMIAYCVKAFSNIKREKQGHNNRKVYRIKDFTGEAVLKMRENYNNGMIKNLLENPHRFKTVPIIE